MVAYSLSKAIDDAKSNLQIEVREGTAIAQRQEQLKFLCRRGSRIKQLELALVTHRKPPCWLLRRRLG